MLALHVISSLSPVGLTTKASNQDSPQVSSLTELLRACKLFIRAKFHSKQFLLNCYGLQVFMKVQMMFRSWLLARI
jgi:hypothetical protein